MSQLAMHVGRRIRVLRRNKNLTQEKLGDLSDLHPNYIGQVERGEKNLTLETLEKICGGLNTTVDRLFYHLPVREETSSDNEKLDEICTVISQMSEDDLSYLLAIILEFEKWANSKNHDKGFN